MEQTPLHPIAVSSLSPLHTHTHTHTHTHACTHVVGPEFHLSQYAAFEGESLVVRLSAPILTRAQTPAFTGRIDVDITAEDLPSGDTQQNALFGM